MCGFAQIKPSDSDVINMEGPDRINKLVSEIYLNRLLYTKVRKYF